MGYSENGNMPKATGDKDCVFVQSDRSDDAGSEVTEQLQ